MKTAKSLGINKGDFVMTGAGFPAIVIGQAHTATPLCEVWGFEHECGSDYAERLSKITKVQFTESAGYKKHPVAFTDVAKKALK